MTESVSIACKYEAFNTLIKINDPDRLFEAFLEQLNLHQEKSLDFTIFELRHSEWCQMQPYGLVTGDFDHQRFSPLSTRVDRQATQSWFYDAQLKSWYCSYKPASNRHFVLVISAENSPASIDEEYIQLLFGFYCHQLNSLERTYRDSLTGLYNRKAFDLRISTLAQSQHHNGRRKHAHHPGVFVMLDIDHFKKINDLYGHLYGDEVLTIVARLMNDSFREYDLLFRYGGEEFCAVLMDIDMEESKSVLERFRLHVANYKFPKNNPVSVSIGYTLFTTDKPIDHLIEQADQALYFGKQQGRNQINPHSLFPENRIN